MAWFHQLKRSNGKKKIFQLFSSLFFIFSKKVLPLKTFNFLMKCFINEKGVFINNVMWYFWGLKINFSCNVLSRTIWTFQPFLPQNFDNILPSLSPMTYDVTHKLPTNTRIYLIENIIARRKKKTQRRRLKTAEMKREITSETYAQRCRNNGKKTLFYDPYRKHPT